MGNLSGDERIDVELDELDLGADLDLSKIEVNIEREEDGGKGWVRGSGNVEEEEEEENLRSSPSSLDLEASKRLTDSTEEETRSEESGDMELSPSVVKITPWISYLVVGVDSMAQNIYVPFLADMCVNRFGISEDGVGTAAGFLQGSYNMAIFCTSFLLGHLSDRYGRRALLLVALAVGAIALIFFSLATSYWQALLLRIIAGAFNAVAPLTKAIITDMSHTSEARTMAFAYQGAAYGASRVVSSSLGGLLSGVVLPIRHLDTNPYFIPCFIAAGFSVITFSIVFFNLPETRKRKGGSRRGEHSLLAGLKYIWQDKLLKKVIVVFMINSFCNGGMILAMVLFYTYPTSGRGLGFSSLEMGFAFAWFGFVCVVFQVTFYEKLSKKYSLLKIYELGTSLFAVTTLALPLVGLIYEFGVSTATHVLVWVVLVVLFGVLSVAFMTCLPVIGTMLSNIGSKERQGLVQGTSQSMASLLRSFGPIVSGALFSFSVTYLNFPILLFIVLSALYMTCFVISRTFTEEERDKLQNTTRQPS